METRKRGRLGGCEANLEGFTAKTRHGPLIYVEIVTHPRLETLTSSLDGTFQQCCRYSLVMMDVSLADAERPVSAADSDPTQCHEQDVRLLRGL